MNKFLILLLAAIIIENSESLAQNVGIGTATPAYKLDVGGRMRIKTGTLNNLGTTSGLWLEDFRTGNDRMFIGMQDSIRAGFYGSGTGGVGWGFNFNATSGNVGIGRTAGSSRLELGDPAGATMSLYSGSNWSGNVRGTDTTLEIYSAYGSSFCFPVSCPSKDLILQPPPFFLGGSFPGNVGIGTNAPKAQVHISSKLMIGSGDPASGYALSVNGKVIAEEMKIQLDAGWPDYVFDEKYKLPSIEKMKLFIDQNNHLPNIPSAKEVEKEGIMVGDMQKRMMEKIEELSLYIIQLNDRIKQLESEKK